MQIGIRAVPRDFAYSFRMLVKRPWFTVAAVSVLALGIGANTAVFSLVNAFLLRPLAVTNPQELTGVYSRDTTKPDSYRGFSYPNYQDLRASGAVFSGLTAYTVSLAGVAEGDTTRRVFAGIISSNYFETLGAPVWRGRGFTPDEERPGSAPPVAIVSYTFWQRHSQSALGSTLRVNGRPLTVVGITPAGFTGTTAMVSPELYFPLGLYEAMNNDFEGAVRPLAARDNNCLMLLGRLRPGLSQPGADRQLAAVGASMERAFPAENKSQALIVRPLSRMSVSTRPPSDAGLFIPAALLLSMAAVVLLIAALNVANMMLARATARRKEIAIRLALGGGRSSIVQQLFMEGLLLALAGGAAGLFFSYVGTKVLVESMSRLAPIDLVFPAAPDVRVLGATLAFCLFSTLLFGFMPAWNLSRANLVSDLRTPDGAGPSSQRRRLFSRRNVLVIAQVSLSLMLLTAAGLFIRSSSRVASADPGFRLDNGVTAEFDASLAGYNEVRGRQVYTALLQRLKAMPGVESASLAATVAFGMVSLGRNVQPLGDPGAAPSKSQGLGFNIVGEDYFKTLGIALLRGRSFRSSEASPSGHPVAIVDKLAASRLWPKGDALGRHIRLLADDGATEFPDVEVVGIVGDTHDHIVGRFDEPHVYVPFGQQYVADMHIHLRVASAPDRFLAAVRQEIRMVDGSLPVLGVKTLRGEMESSADYWVVRTGAQMFSLFGGIALLLAAIGLYAVRAYSVARRTREIGIRMALGASGGEARRMVLREGLQLMAAGAGIGLVLSLLVGRALAGLLFQVNGADPAVFSTAVLLLGSVSLIACYIPARRASRVDPLVALRYE